MDNQNTKTVLNITSYKPLSQDGRNYLIVPAVPAKEQVMNTYLVPASELSFASMWNGAPITIRHPKQNNGSANVPQPDVAVIGKFYNAEWNESEKKLSGEYWIDVDEAMKYVEGQYIINAIYANQVLETSTGYWADEEVSPGEFDGRKYATIHRNIRPDHIAILVDEIGACSVADGCGVNRNSLVQKLYQNECLEQNGGRGSGDFGHLGRPGQVGGSQPKARRKQDPHEKGHKTLARDVNAYYVASKDKARSYSDGFKRSTSFMTKAKAAKLFESMTRGGFDPVIFEIRLKKGTPYSSISSSSITLPSVPASQVHTISIDSLNKRKSTTFSKNFLQENDCGCPEMEKNESSESLSERIDKVRSGFYREFMQESTTPYIMEVFEDHCLVEYGNDKYNAYYKTNSDGEIEFEEQEKWKKLELVEQNAEEEEEVVSNVVAKDAPKKVKEIFEKVYKQALLKFKDKAKAAKIAWGAVHNAGWKQDEKGKWYKEKKGAAVSNKEKVLSTNKSSKENTMKKLSLNAILETLKGKGVDVQVNNEEELGEDFELDLSGDEEEEEVEEPTNLNAATPQFNAEEVSALKKLAAVDWTKINKFMDNLPTIMEVAQNAETEKVTRKNELVGLIMNSSDNTFTKEELEAMSLPVLTKMNARMNVSYAGMGGFTFAVNSDDEVLGLPSISTEKE